METKQVPKEPISLMAFVTMLCYTYLMLLTYVCWQLERMCRALSGCGQRVLLF
jgi:hypothetical protein